MADNPTDGNSGASSTAVDNGDASTQENPVVDENIDAGEISLMRKLLRTGLTDSKNNVEILRSDPKSPLYSVKSFEELRLPEEFLKGIYEMGFSAPSKIQETVLPVLLSNPPTNIIAQSQSGTGKTAAFLLSSLCRVDTSKKYPQIIILSPTFELALQTGEVAKKMAQFKADLGFTFAVKGSTYRPNETIEEQVIIGTPGKVTDMAFRYKVFDLKQINVFVLDEADVMIDTQGHRSQSLRIQKGLSKTCQIMFFSATYDARVMEFAEMIVPNPVIIRLKREEQSLDNIYQFYVECPNEEEKYRAIANLYGNLFIASMFIFTQTKKSAIWLANKLRSDGHSVGVIHGDLDVEQRNEMIKSFRENRERVLISTNLMARGIDVEQVTVVINYDLPYDVHKRDIDYETYLHRIGRTGRFGKSGTAINFIDKPRDLEYIRKLEKHYGKQIEKLDTNDFDGLEDLAQKLI